MKLKKYFSGVALFLVTIVSAHAQNLSQIAGQLKTNSSTMKLFKIVEGRLEEIASSIPSANGYFGFVFKPEYKGYYVVAGDARVGNYKFYFKGGDQLNFEINDTSYVLKGANSKENTLLTEWHNTVASLEYNTCRSFRKNYKQLFPMITTASNQSKDWMKGKTSGNKEFDQLLAQTIDYDVLSYAMILKSTPRSAHPTVEEYNDYLKNLDPAKYLSNTDLLKYPYGTRILEPLAYFKLKGDDRKFDNALALIPNDQLKGELALDYVRSAQSYTMYQELVDKYGKYFITADQKQRSQAAGAKLATFKPTEKALNFTYPDLNEKQVSLTDFKGKVVLVDVWATWCGPCKKEIPALKQLEEELRGKDVVFMSVSVDEEKDKEKWKKFVADQGLKGVQLFASGWSDIAKNYKITGIPRFMLFDKKGNIINVDAPRPSDPKLKETILEWLNK